MRKVLVILFLIISSVVSATNYYVKNGGSDAASGTSDETAWAHHPWMSTWTGHITLVAGDNVFMRRGDTWSISTPSASYMTVGQSGSTGRPITTTAYGSGAKPIIKIAGDFAYPVIKGLGKAYITLDNLDVQHFGATRNIGNYQDGIVLGYDGANVVPHDWIITNCDIHNIPSVGIEVLDDAYNIIIGNPSATVCATATSYSNQIYNCGYAGVVLTGQDPATHFSHFDVYFNYIHDIDNTNNLRDAYGITFSSNYSNGKGQGYSTGWPSYAVARYNRIEDVTGHSGIDCHGGTYIYIQDNYVYNCLHSIYAQAADRANQETAVLDNCYIERNIIENSGASALAYQVFIYVVAENDAKRATHCYVRDNIISYSDRNSQVSSYGICTYSVDGITIEGNEVYTGGIIAGYSGSSAKVKNVIIRNNFVRLYDSGILLGADGIDGPFSIYNNIVYAHRPINCKAGTISDTIKIYNNTLLSVPAIYPYCIDFNTNGAVSIATGAFVNIKNNIAILTTPVADGMYIRPPTTITGTFTCDQNLYWNSLNANPFSFNGTNQNWADWNALGYDTHSLNNTDPLFINKSGSYSESLDFELKNTSPAINKGTVVSGVTDDFFGNPRDATPDIGACEYIIQVTGITVTGAAGSNTITTSKGTLQLISSISPSDAANKTVTWSIISGTGQASISSAGLVTAIANGTVTAKVTAKDGSGVYGTLFITISNQGNADSTNFKGQPVTIYPNPAHEYINIRIVEQKLIPDFIRIFNLSGKVVLQYKVNPDVTELHIPLNLIEGIYILQMGARNVTMFAQKLIIGK
jgi:hypothetical protein